MLIDAFIAHRVQKQSSHAPAKTGAIQPHHMSDAATPNTAARVAPTIGHLPRPQARPLVGYGLDWGLWVSAPDNLVASGAP